MKRTFRTSLAAGVTALLLAGFMPTGEAATGDAATGATSEHAAGAEPGDLLEDPARGETAIAELGAGIARAAARNDLSTAQLRDLLRTDRTAWVDPRGQLFYVDHFPEPAHASVAAAAPYPYDQTFSLHSRAGSTRKVFLDFDGHSVSGTVWNDETGVGTAAQPAFGLDADPTFGNAERDAIQSVWQRVSEDFAPFDVDVTTEDPGLEALRRTNLSDSAFGMRALITPSDLAADAICGGGCGGVAYVGAYDWPDDFLPGTMYLHPAWVFPQHLGNDTKAIAEAVSHEVGHTLGLHHDGTSSEDYYEGHGAWAPIMGVGYYSPVTQWSQGEYAGASNLQGDLSVMTTYGLPLRQDEHLDTRATATALGGGTILTGAGVISTRGDKDYFSVVRGCAGTMTVTADPAPTSPNLDIGLKVFTADGAQLADANPPSSTVNADRASGLDASTTASLPAGTFFIEVDGVGALTPTIGYSDYGSLGAYTMTATGCGDVPAGPDSGASAPLGVSATAGDRRATVTWSPPADAGTHPIDGYEVTTYRGAVPQSTRIATASARSSTTTGLINGQSYSFEVRATTAFGDGAPARSPAVTPKGAPGAPRIGTARAGAAGGQVTATAVWSAPTSTGGSPITGYRVTALRVAGAATVLSRTVSGVRPASGRSFAMVLPRRDTYRFTVRAVNALGTGSASAMSNKVTGR